MRIALLMLIVAGGLALRAAIPEPPALPREFRGLWIASVGNIDWPTKSGLPVTTQQAQLRGLLDTAKRLNLNVVILQVRTGCDALYESPYEPWSEYLTGRMGQAPKPKWDPLRFACDEAHLRGLELHAWINPFRARYHQALSPVAADHVTRRHPEWVVPYGRYLWLDPGNPAARAWSLKVITDIVRRYDVDGLHLDDYFYPYPEAAANGGSLPFADEASYDRYREHGGRLLREEWRRENINDFILGLGPAIHAEKSWVKFGLSPFGIWRPGSPAGIKGLDAFKSLSADAKLWFNRGWCDYLAPQLYWPNSRREQSFPALLQWWAGENTANRLLVPGLASASVGKDRPAADITEQVRLARTDRGAAGVVLWNASSLRDNLDGVATALLRDAFAQPALVPAAPWLMAPVPGVPGLSVATGFRAHRLTVRWSVPANAAVLVFQTRLGTHWQQEILPAHNGRRDWEGTRGRTLPDEVRIFAVGRTGLAGGASRCLPPTATP